MRRGRTSRNGIVHVQQWHLSQGMRLRNPYQAACRSRLIALRRPDYFVTRPRHDRHGARQARRQPLSRRNAQELWTRDLIKDIDPTRQLHGLNLRHSQPAPGSRKRTSGALSRMPQARQTDRGRIGGLAKRRERRASCRGNCPSAQTRGDDDR